MAISFSAILLFMVYGIKRIKNMMMKPETMYLDLEKRGRQAMGQPGPGTKLGIMDSNRYFPNLNFKALIPKFLIFPLYLKKTSF